MEKALLVPLAPKINMKHETLIDDARSDTENSFFAFGFA
jgi:hypothetical protein